MPSTVRLVKATWRMVAKTRLTTALPLESTKPKRKQALPVSPVSENCPLGPEKVKPETAAQSLAATAPQSPPEGSTADSRVALPTPVVLHSRVAVSVVTIKSVSLVELTSTAAAPAALSVTVSVSRVGATEPELPLEPPTEPLLVDPLLPLPPVDPLPLPELPPELLWVDPLLLEVELLPLDVTPLLEPLVPLELALLDVAPLLEEVPLDAELAEDPPVVVEVELEVDEELEVEVEVAVELLVEVEVEVLDPDDVEPAVVELELELELVVVEVLDPDDVETLGVEGPQAASSTSPVQAVRSEEKTRVMVWLRTSVGEARASPAVAGEEDAVHVLRFEGGSVW